MLTQRKGHLQALLVLHLRALTPPSAAQIRNTGEKTLRYISVVSEPPISINVYKTWETCDDTVCKDENQIVDDTESVSPTWWDRKYASAGGYESYMRRVRKAAKKQAEEAAKNGEL